LAFVPGSRAFLGGLPVKPDGRIGAIRAATGDQDENARAALDAAADQLK
jgi:hypothetical protein